MTTLDSISTKLAELTADIALLQQDVRELRSQGNKHTTLFADLHRDIRDSLDQLTVLTGICVRLEGSMQGLIIEIGGLRGRLHHFDQRLRTFEEPKT